MSPTISGTSPALSGFRQPLGSIAPWPSPQTLILTTIRRPRFESVYEARTLTSIASLPLNTVTNPLFRNHVQPVPVCLAVYKSYHVRKYCARKRLDAYFFAVLMPVDAVNSSVAGTVDPDIFFLSKVGAGAVRRALYAVLGVYLLDILEHQEGDGVFHRDAPGVLRLAWAAEGVQQARVRENTLLKMAAKIRGKQLKKSGGASPSTPPNNDSDGVQTHGQGQDPEAQVGLAKSLSPQAKTPLADSPRLRALRPPLHLPESGLSHLGARAARGSKRAPRTRTRRSSTCSPRSRALLGFIEGVLPTVLLAVLMMLLPIVLQALARLEGILRRTGLELSLMTRYFMFLVVVTALLPDHAPLLGHHYDSPADRRGPGLTGFLVTVTLILHYINLNLLDSTPRSIYRLKYRARSVAWGTLFSGMAHLIIIGLGSSIIAPVISGLVCVGFVCFYLYKYLFLWVPEQPASFDIGGLFFPKAITTSSSGSMCSSPASGAVLPRGEGHADADPGGRADDRSMINNSYGPLWHSLALLLVDRIEVNPLQIPHEQQRWK
ncbi:hypothetical protein FIBSPDRAFT_935283 [Athelia psychrophila]|uniref:CSC1/OSCA1-like 7TM region domain-containing protein n=1 Tax=Athelia psychrophila TaxID=1759441 RepID=A0A166E2T3_9AGAM|nr:hypothetical protein FIBSPDRAFT_935283 [Fibularhizoctonia sp. CBS 109695]